MGVSTWFSTRGDIVAEDQKTAEEQKVCFVIAPIGEIGSPGRKRSDQVLKHLIRPATKECGYAAQRADEISEPGIITSQVIQRLIDAALVIADLTTHNANVFYELAVRHAIRRPLVQIIAVGEAIPFDVSPVRTIQFDLADPDSLELAREALIRQVQSVEKDSTLVDNPISTAIDLGALKATGKSGDAQLATVIEGLNELRSEVRALRPSVPSLNMSFGAGKSAPVSLEKMLGPVSNQSIDDLLEQLRIVAGLKAAPEK